MLPRGVIKTTPDDFVVEELPLYEPSGAGDHLYVRFTKRGLTTDAAVRAIARAMQVEARDVGVPGLKDKVAVTTQTISLPAPAKDASFDDRARALAIDGVTILEARRHANKLRTGHLAGNRFTIVVRGIDPARLDEARAAFDRIAREGAPNFYGVQRFGASRDNAERAREWIVGGAKPPRDPRARRFAWSALQSAIFNDVLAARVEAGTWATPLEGDVLQKTDSGGLFVCADVEADRARCERDEIVPTGPLPGAKMRAPTGEPLALETQITAKWLGEAFDFETTRALGEGTRRPLRLRAREVVVNDAAAIDPKEQPAALRVSFVLPRGAYATTVLSAVFDWEEPADGPEQSHD